MLFLVDSPGQNPSGPVNSLRFNPPNLFLFLFLISKSSLQELNVIYLLHCLYSITIREILALCYMNVHCMIYTPRMT